MKVIYLKDYSSSMGTLIDVRHPIDYDKDKICDKSINIYYEKLLNNPSKYLNKNSKYYLMCKKGILSRRTVRMLEMIGYDVTLVR